MNEITRIHLAKVAYDVEVSAKKQLEKYIKSLETYTGDGEVLRDIEIRMTELLEERGVKAGGVITSADVTAIRGQLGEPYEFADEDGDIAVGAMDGRDERKFFRSTDDAILGGVLSGIAAYFRVNPLWTRLMFILLIFASFGLAIFGYILLWIVVPPTRTATDKLKQAGRPVTLDSIRELNESEEKTVPNRVAPIIKRTLTVFFGVVSLMGAMATLCVIFAAVFGVQFTDISAVSARLGFVSDDASMTLTAWVVYGMFLFGSALLAALFSLVAYAFFVQKLSKRALVSGIIIIAVGLSTFAATVGVISTQAWRVSNEAQNLMKQTKVDLPKEFSGVTSLEIEAVNSKSEVAIYETGYPSIQYIVDEGAPRYALSALPGVKPSISVSGETAKLSLTMPNDYRNTFVQARLTIYGPALTKITNHAANTTYSAISQDALTITAKGGSNLSVNGGSFGVATVSGAGSVDLGSASVTALVIDAEQGMNVSAGTVRSLTVSQPAVCPVGSAASSTVQVAEVISNKMTYNGEERTAATYRTSCAEVVIGDEDYSVRYQ